MSDERQAPALARSEDSSWLASVSAPVRARARIRAPKGVGKLLTVLAPARAALARIPRAAWVCALLAIVNAACWSILTPPFQALDEPDHFAYVQHLVEDASLPAGAFYGYSPEEELALSDLHQQVVRFNPAAHPIFTDAEQSKLQSDLAEPISRSSPGGTGVAASEPPLYYALQAIPYELASGASILDRLALMRLLSALMAGFTVLFVFLFLREALPRHRWAWTVGGLGVGLGPLLAFSSSTVNPDALLFTVSAALFYCLARAFRHGLTQRSAIAIGALIAVGFLTKLNFIGLAPGVIFGLIALAHRQARRSGTSAYTRMLAPAILIALGPGILYGLHNALSHNLAFGFISAELKTITGGHGSILNELNYMWQYYLPRLPGMHNDFGELFTTRQFWLRNLLGLYGWGDTAFPGWVYDFALIPLGLIAVLCIRSLVICRSALRSRKAELATYAIMLVGLMVLVAASGYVTFPRIVAEFTDARYAVPMLALWAAVLALAARGAGRRWGPAVGALIVVLVLAHDIFSQLQVLARYYS